MFCCRVLCMSKLFRLQRFVGSGGRQAACFFAKPAWRPQETFKHRRLQWLVSVDCALRMRQLDSPSGSFCADRRGSTHNDTAIHTCFGV